MMIKNFVEKLDEDIESFFSGELLNKFTNVSFFKREIKKTYIFQFAEKYNNELKEITGKDILEDIPFGGEYDKFCLRMNSLTEDEYILLELNNIRVHENLKINKKDEVEYE